MKQSFFKVFKNITPLFTKFGINRKIVGVGKIHDFFYKFFWPYNRIIAIQGSKMLIDSKDASPEMLKTFEAYAENLIHEKATTELFKKIVKKGDTVVDLGANIGYFTLLASSLVGPKGKVFAFEPEPKNYNYLIKNIKLNNYKQTTAFQKAISDKNGMTKLFICSYDTGHHTIKQSNGIEAYKHGRVLGKEEFIDIETVTLDEFFKNNEKSIDVIKMDVEGAEFLALKGMDRVLRVNERIKMFIEFFPLLIKKMGDSPEEFIKKIIQDYKFSIFIIPDDYDAKIDKITQIREVSEIMKYCQGEEDHINLFLKHNENNKINSKKN